MKQEKLRIAYVLGSKFPTFKAYGITTRETIQVLLGKSFEVQILCAKSYYSDSDHENIVKYINNYPDTNIRKVLYCLGTSKYKKINKYFWKSIFFLNILSSIRPLTRFKPDVIWLRDPWSAVIYLKLFKNTKVVVEVHDMNHKVIYKKIRNHLDRLVLLPISKELVKVLESLNPELNLILSPMGVRKFNSVPKEACINFANSLGNGRKSDLKIGYIGKISPAGYSKGVEIFIELATYYLENNINNLISIIGATDKEYEDLSRVLSKLKITEKYLIVEKHMDHSSALEAMKNLDILVLPAYKTKHYAGMPIKLLEYLSSGKIVLVANTELYRSYFDNSFTPFFYTEGSVDSLHMAISKAISVKNLGDHIFLGAEFASRHTWEARTNKVLTRITRNLT